MFGLGCLGQDLHQAIARLVHADHRLGPDRLVESQTGRTRVAQVRAHQPRVQQHRVQPLVLRIDARAEPGRCRLGRAVARIWDWGLRALWGESVESAPAT